MSTAFRAQSFWGLVYLLVLLEILDLFSDVAALGHTYDRNMKWQHLPTVLCLASANTHFMQNLCSLIIKGFGDLILAVLLSDINRQRGMGNKPVGISLKGIPQNWSQHWYPIGSSGSTEMTALLLFLFTHQTNDFLWPRCALIVRAVWS